MPYWGDSSYADRIDYRHDTPLQSTIDGVTVAQFFIFGMFGVDPQFDGTIQVSPHRAAFTAKASLQGIKMRGVLFDIELGDQEFKVTIDGKAGTATALAVVVGDLSITVSERTPPRSSPAVFFSILAPFLLKSSATRVEVDPTGSQINGIGAWLWKLPILWWSTTSMILTLSAPSTA